MKVQSPVENRILTAAVEFADHALSETDETNVEAVVVAFTGCTLALAATMQTLDKLKPGAAELSQMREQAIALLRTL